jgi:hypothetical protein
MPTLRWFGTERAARAASARCLLTVSAVLAVLLLGAPAQAQVFLASRQDPSFTISPLFVTLRVTPERGKEMLDVFWSLSPRRGSRSIPITDLVLLLPFAVTAPTASRGDADAVGYIENRGFGVTGQGSLELVGVERRAMGSGQRKVLGTVPFVTFDSPVTQGRSRPATYIPIAWTKYLADPDWLVGLSMNASALITPKSTSWAEEAFWGPRLVASLAFGDLGYVALYRLYYEHRDSVVLLGRDFSQLRITFAEALHLRIDQTAPATAKRAPSESRAGTEVVAVPLTGGGITPQAMRIEYAYAGDWRAWQPVLISLLLLMIGNVAGPLVMPVFSRAARAIATRFEVGRDAGRQSGVILAPETLDRLQTGATSYEDVLRLCGSDCEEQEHRSRDSRRILAYRGRRIVPRRRWRLWRLANVSRWDVEHHEVDIELQDGRVSNVQARVRRSKWVPVAGT